MWPSRLCREARQDREQGSRGGLVGWAYSRVEDDLHRAPTKCGEMGVRAKVWRGSDSVDPQGGGGPRCSEGEWVGMGGGVLSRATDWGLRVPALRVGLGVALDRRASAPRSRPPSSCGRFRMVW